MKFNFVSILLNFILVFVIVLGIVLYLQKDKSGGTKHKNITQKSNEISKNIDINQVNYIKKLKAIITKQKREIAIIQRDNEQLSNEKEDLEKIIQNMKNQFKNQIDRLLKQNMKQINEAEQQHYKNISELRIKINDLQKENIKLLERNNIEIISLKAKINILNDKLLKNK